MQNMQNMQNIHSELAIQQRVDFSIGSGNQSGQDFLEREADSTMNHEIVPKSINRLRLAQNMSAGRISKKNMQSLIFLIGNRINRCHYFCLLNYFTKDKIQWVSEIRTSLDFWQLVLVQFTACPDFRQCLKSGQQSVWNLDGNQLFKSFIALKCVYFWTTRPLPFADTKSCLKYKLWSIRISNVRISDIHCIYLWKEDASHLFPA